MPSKFSGDGPDQYEHTYRLCEWVEIHIVEAEQVPGFEQPIGRHSPFSKNTMIQTQ